MMPIYLEQRFHLLLEFAKDVKHPTVARENLAAAKELVDTLFATGHLDAVESRAYRKLCTAAGIMVGTSELKRSAHLPNVSDCANGRMHDAPKKVVTTMPGGYIA